MTAIDLATAPVNHSQNLINVKGLAKRIENRQLFHNTIKININGINNRPSCLQFSKFLNKGIDQYLSATVHNAVQLKCSS